MPIDADATPAAGRSVTVRHILAVASVAVLGVVASLLVFTSARTLQRQALRDEFAARSEERMTAVERAVREDIDVLYAVSAFYDASKFVDRDEFSAFTAPILARHPGIQALEWAPKVAHGQRAEFEVALRDEGLAGFAITERGADGEVTASARRDVYHPVLYVEPFDGNEAALGYDLSSQATRRQALDEAAATGEAVATSRIRLVQRGDEYGVLILLAKYARRPADEASVDRADRLLGYVVAVLRPDGCVESAVSYFELAGIDFQLTDESAVPGERILATHVSRAGGERGAEPAKTPLTARHAFDVGTRTWAVTCTPAPAFLARKASAVPRNVLGVGLLITLLGVGYVHRVSSERERVRSLVNLRTAELSQANAALCDQAKALEAGEEHLRTANERLETALEEAESASRAKSEFLAGMSHELRTPLNAVIGFTSGLLDRVDKHPLTDYQKNRLTRVKLAGQHLLSLINDILDIAKVEAGEMTVNATTIDAAGLVEEVGGLAEALLGAKRDRIVFECDAENAIAPLVSDRDKIKQVLINLLSNAIKFTESGRVTLRASMEAEHVQFVVEDTGCGIPQAEVHRVFEKFHQVGDRHVQGGTGLGLALCRQLATLLGATLRVRSVEGEGSRFTLSVPSRADLAAAAAPDTGEMERQLAAELEAAEPLDANARVVMCVEDDADNMLLLNDYLTEAGCRVIPLFDGTDAVRTAREQRPDLIVLDVMMPGLDGWEVLRRLKSDPDTRDVPVILSTAIEDREFGLGLGASDYLVKPLDKDQLVDSVRRLAASAGAAREVAVVDDDSMMRDLLRFLLEKEGCTVRLFENGRGFLEALPEWLPDLVVLDLMMPEVDGFAVVDAMRADARWRDIPTIVLTALRMTPEQLQQLNGVEHIVLDQDADARAEGVTQIARLLETLPERGRAA